MCVQYLEIINSISDDCGDDDEMMKKSIVKMLRDVRSLPGASSTLLLFCCYCSVLLPLLILLLLLLLRAHISVLLYTGVLGLFYFCEKISSVLFCVRVSSSSDESPWLLLDGWTADADG